MPLPDCGRFTVALLGSALRWPLRYLSGDCFAGLSENADIVFGPLSESAKGVVVEKGGI